MATGRLNGVRRRSDLLGQNLGLKPDRRRDACGGPANCPESIFSGIGELRAADRKHGSLGCSSLVRGFRPQTGETKLNPAATSNGGTDERDNARLIPAMPAVGKRILVYPRCVFQCFGMQSDASA